MIKSELRWKEASLVKSLLNTPLLSLVPPQYHTPQYDSQVAFATCHIGVGATLYIPREPYP